MPGLVRLTDPATNQPFAVDANEVAGALPDPSFMVVLTDGYNLFARPATRLRSVFGGSALAAEDTDAVIAQVNALRNQPVVVVQTVVNIAAPAGPAMLDAQPEKPKRTIGFGVPAAPAPKAA